MKAEQFQTDAEAKAFDREHRRKIRFNIGKYDAAVSAGLSLLRPTTSWPATAAPTSRPRCWKSWTSTCCEFEAAFTARGGRVIWARDAAEALAEIGEADARPAAPKRW
ncbi:MAG: hypothetical protein WKG07_19205 [Hymenobacter sp.]